MRYVEKPWKYFEYLALNFHLYFQLSSNRFTHLLVEDSAATKSFQSVLKETHIVWGEIDAFEKLEVDFKKFPPVAIKLRRAIIIYKKFHV